MVVKNVNNAPAIGTCRCGSWLIHWRRYGKPSPAFLAQSRCAVAVCRNPADTAVPVQKEVLESPPIHGMAGDSTWYIVPLCQDCARKRGERLILDDHCGLAPTHVLETCGRSEKDDDKTRSA
jgi:hypothetical protein